jgi:hypothetical protein
MISFDKYFQEQFQRVRSTTDQLKFGNNPIPGDDYNFEFDTKKWKDKKDKITKEFIPDDPAMGLRQNISNEISTRLNTIFRSYGFDLGGKELNKLPTNGSMVYRGHKSPSPTSKGYDAKAEGSKVYWSLNPKYAFSVYSKGNNQMSTQIGQAGGSSFQKALHPDQKSNISYSIGFFSIATPKDSSSIDWYRNFGYEDKESPTPINEVLTWPSRQQYEAECVTENTSFNKIRTYLVNQYGQAISFNRLRKISPPIYKQVINSSVYGSNDVSVY